MEKSNYDARRPMFWVITSIAGVVVIHATVTFVRDGFSHPVSSIADIIVKGGVWLAYSEIVSDLRAVRGQITDTLATRVEMSAAMCCMMGYALALHQINW